MKTLAHQPVIHWLWFRSLEQAKLTGPATAHYKQDRRSRVWAVEAENQQIVIKRFEYAPFRQITGLGALIHPAQYELRANAALRKANFPVVPIIDGGIEACRAWLATPYQGQSLNKLLPDQAEALLPDIVSLMQQLIDAGFTFKDFKPSNIIQADADQLKLIDVGSISRSTSKRHIQTMIDVMHRVLGRHNVPDDLRDHFKQQAQQMI